MSGKKILAWFAVVLSALFFFLPLVGTFIFSLSMRRGVYSFDAYASVFSMPEFRSSFAYSILLAILTIIIGTLLVVPTAYWIRLRVPQMRPVVEFITLLPLVIPAIIIVFGYTQLYGSGSPIYLPFMANDLATDLLLIFAYMTISLPYMYRAVDEAMRAIDVRVLTEAAESLGASGLTVMFRCIFPNVISGVLSGAFITFAIVIGEFTIASLLNRPAFGPYLQLVGANRAYEPSALAMVAFIITWASMGLINIFSRFQRTSRTKA